MNPWAIVSIVFNTLLPVIYVILLRVTWDHTQENYWIIVAWAMILVLIRIIFLIVTLRYAFIKNPTKQQEKILKFVGIFSIFIIPEALYVISSILLLVSMLFFIAYVIQPPEPTTDDNENENEPRTDDNENENDSGTTGDNAEIDTTTTTPQ